MEKQVLDGTFLFSEERSVNSLYSKVINMDICPPPVENNSFQQQMSGSSWDLPDRGNFFLRKRKWFQPARFMRMGVEEDLSDWEFTDSVFVEGTRFMMAVSKDKEKMRVYKQMWTIDIDKCAEEEDAPYQEGWFENITVYTYNKPNAWIVLASHFPHSVCLSDKFAIGYWPKWLLVEQWKEPFNYQPSTSLSLWIQRWRIINKVVWNEVFTYFVDEVNQTIQWNPWDYVYIFDWPYSSQHLWISWVEGNTWEWKQWLLMESSFAWFSSLSIPIQSTSIRSDWLIQQTYEWLRVEDFERSEVSSYLIFQNRWDILYFATSNWIYSLNNDWNSFRDSCFVYEWNTHKDTYDNEISPLFVISSIVNSNESIVFIDSKRWLLYHWLYWYQNTYFDPRNVLSVWWKYTDIAILSWYVLLLWREDVSLVKVTNPSLGAISYSGFLQVAQDVWYWNKGSWKAMGGVLSWFWSDKQYRKTILETFWNDIVVPKTQVEQTYYNWLLSSLFRWRDNVSIWYDWRKEYLIISTKRWPILNWTSTIVLVKDFFWHQWIYEWFYLTWFDRLWAYWYWVFWYWWSRDNTNEIRTLIQMNFWEYNSITPKDVLCFKYIIWYNSTITFWNSLVRFWCDYWWYRYKWAYWELYRRQYISDIMKAKSEQNSSAKLREFWYWWDVTFWFWMTWQSRTFRTPERESFNFQFDQFEFDKDTFDNVSYELSKYWIIEEPVNVPCNNMVIEFATKWDDEVEFWWFMVWFAFRDAFETRIEDVGIIGDTQLSWMSKDPLT
jgi:hypothetical protein